MKNLLIILCSIVLLVYNKVGAQNTIKEGSKITMSKDVLEDKIKGGWAGQTVGVTFGGPYEFQFNGTFIQDYQPLLWNESYLKKNMLDWPGLYDDLYMDLTFVEVFEKYGLFAPIDSFANAFANAQYMLWHANQAARYNILNGIKAPQSGHWKNNPHSDDIDYQIESDFAGLMSPGMPNTASVISDKIGHIMNYGDGWYGGVFIGAMYSLAFVSSDINYIVSEALKTIPQQSTFYQCIIDVINWHKQYPDDWQRNWFEIQKKWSNDLACPDGIFKPFNIDAKINSAYVVLGLLYGNGDYSRTLEVATRAGQDADCNPSSAGGILGTIMGYKNIPVYWKMGLNEVEDINFKYTNISLNKTYEIGFKHALQNIINNGGEVSDDKVEILVQLPKPVKLEQGFPNMYPVKRVKIDKDDIKDFSFEFEGSGFIISGNAEKKTDDVPNYIFNAELYVDNQKVETAKFPTDFTTRRLELFWKYELPVKTHSVTIKVLNPDSRYSFNCSSYIIFSNKPIPKDH